MERTRWCASSMNREISASIWADFSSLVMLAGARFPGLNLDWRDRSYGSP